MRTAFARTSNVDRFLAGVHAIEHRGAREASMLLVTGEPGYGKTATVHWWATHHGGVYLRANAAHTSHWILSDLVRELGLAPAVTTEQIFIQAARIMASEPRPLVIDEVEHTLRDSRVIESIRDLSDRFRFPVVLVGMDQVQGRIARHAQISSRVAQVVQFGPATVEDVRICCDALCEVPVADDLVEEIRRQSMGRIREILNAIAVVERAGKRNGGRKVALSDMIGQALTHDWQARRPRIVKAGAVARPDRPGALPRPGAAAPADRAKAGAVR